MLWRELLFIGVPTLIIGALIVATIVFLIWWMKIKKIEKNIPKINADDGRELHKLNYDQNYIERRQVTNGDANQEEERSERFRQPHERRYNGGGTGGSFGGGRETNTQSIPSIQSSGEKEDLRRGNANTAGKVGNDRVQERPVGSGNIQIRTPKDVSSDKPKFRFSR